MDLAERLREIRKERGETQAEAAETAGITVRQYQGLEAGTSLPSFKSLCALADHFQVNLDYLAGRTDVREMLPPLGREPV